MSPALDMTGEQMKKETERVPPRPEMGTTTNPIFPGFLLS
jgi:hypothetical protein